MQKGYRIVGPMVREGSVVWETISSVFELPIGWRDHQEPGRYRLEQTGSPEIFGVVHGSQSLKQFVFAPREPLLQIERSKDGFATTPDASAIGESGDHRRSCVRSGRTATQDQIFLNDAYRDPYYASRREGLFVIAVNCTRALSNLFLRIDGDRPPCRSMASISSLTEVDDSLLIEAGSEAGREVLATSPFTRASEELIAEANDARRRLRPEPSQTVGSLTLAAGSL